MEDKNQTLWIDNLTLLSSQVAEIKILVKSDFSQNVSQNPALSEHPDIALITPYAKFQLRCTSMTLKGYSLTSNEAASTEALWRSSSGENCCFIMCLYREV